MKTYEAIRKTQVVNEKNKPVAEMKVGDEITGEIVEIDDNLYVESSDGYVLAEDVAESVETADSKSDGKRLSSSSKKLVIALIGLAVGFAFAKWRKMGTKGVVISCLAGLTAGLVFDYFQNKKNDQ